MILYGQLAHAGSSEKLQASPRRTRTRSTNREIGEPRIIGRLKSFRKEERYGGYNGCRSGAKESRNVRYQEVLQHRGEYRRDILPEVFGFFRREGKESGEMPVRAREYPGYLLNGSFASVLSWVIVGDRG